MAENDLKLDESVFRFLFTSPAYFVGECSGEGFYLTPAFQSFGRRRNRFDPSTDGSTFVLAVRAEPSTRESVRLETYEWVGEEASAIGGLLRQTNSEPGPHPVRKHIDRADWGSLAHN